MFQKRKTRQCLRKKGVQRTSIGITNNNIILSMSFLNHQRQTKARNSAIRKPPPLEAHVAADIAIVSVTNGDDLAILGSHVFERAFWGHLGVYSSPDTSALSPDHEQCDNYRNMPSERVLIALPVGVTGDR